VTLARVCGGCGRDLPPAGPGAWEREFPIEPPSGNALVVKRPQGAWAKRKLYDKFRDDYALLFMAWKHGAPIPVATGRRRVFVHRIYKSARYERDDDNLISGCKPLIDALTRAGLITDDNPAGIERHCSQEQTNRAGVIVRIEEI